MASYYSAVYSAGLTSQGRNNLRNLLGQIESVAIRTLAGVNLPAYSNLVEALETRPEFKGGSQSQFTGEPGGNQNAEARAALQGLRQYVLDPLMQRVDSLSAEPQQNTPLTYQEVVAATPGFVLAAPVPPTLPRLPGQTPTTVNVVPRLPGVSFDTTQNPVPQEPVSPQVTISQTDAQIAARAVADLDIDTLMRTAVSFEELARSARSASPQTFPEVAAGIASLLAPMPANIVAQAIRSYLTADRLNPENIINKDARNLLAQRLGYKDFSDLFSASYLDPRPSVGEFSAVRVRQLVDLLAAQVVMKLRTPNLAPVVP